VDESTAWLKPVLQDVGSRREQPIAQVNWRFRWLYGATLASALSREKRIGGFCPVNINLFNQLADFAKHFSLANNKSFWRWIEAGWHTVRK